MAALGAEENSGREQMNMAVSIGIICGCVGIPEVIRSPRPANDTKTSRASDGGAAYLYQDIQRERAKA